MDEVVKKCDFRVGRGKTAKPHGITVESGESTKYRVDGVEYTADLCDEHRAAMTEILAPFLEVSRRVGRVTAKNARGRVVMRAKGGVTFTTKDVRVWLEEQGKAVPATGRIPNALIDEYKDAHSLA